MGDREIVFDHITIAMERMADASPGLAGTRGGVPGSGVPSRVFDSAS